MRLELGRDPDDRIRRIHQYNDVIDSMLVSHRALTVERLVEAAPRPATSAHAQQ